MIKLRFLAALLLAGWGMAAFSMPARASTMTLCNNGDFPLKVAMVYQSAIFYPLTEEWSSWGWIDVDPGCKQIVRQDGRLELFLSVTEVYAGERHIMHFPLQSEEVRHTAVNTSLTAERFFCVADRVFDQTFDTLEAHETCRGDYYRQLFNVYIYLDPYNEFTLTIG